MRVAIAGMCGVVAVGVFLAMYLSVWNTRSHPARDGGFRQHIISELIWMTIPILMLIAGAFPTAIAILSSDVAR